MRAIWIDDDRFMIYNLKNLFSLYGVEVNHFSDYAEGIDELKKDPTYDFILLDLMMPVGNLKENETNGGNYTGIKVYKIIREFYTGPIIFYTVHRSNERFSDLFEKDHKLAHLPKPQSPEIILDTIKKLKL
nr:response regulator [uncultured Draconibacterium sp.]